MIEILGLVFGAVARLAPTLFSFLKEGRDLKYEVMRLDKEAELERLRGANARAEIQAASAASVDASWAQAMVEAIRTATPPQLADSGRWYLNVLNALNVSVRPVLTYWWCIVLYTAAKAILVYVAIDGGWSSRTWPA